MGQCSGTRSPPGAVSRSRKREQEAARSNRRASLVSAEVTRDALSGMRKRLLTKLRVHLVANMVEGHHEGVLHAACGR